MVIEGLTSQIPVKDPNGKHICTKKNNKIVHDKK